MRFLVVVLTVLLSFPALASEETRSAYAKQIEHSILSAGVSVDVMTDAPKNPMKLVLFGVWNKADVFQLITSFKLLNDARDAGWESVEIFSKTSSGKWTFDLRGMVPRCDIYKRICID